MVEIKNLYECPEYINIVVNWIYSEWGSNNFKYWDSWVRSSVNKESIPMTFVVFVDDKVAGTYSLWNCDMQSRQDLSPWLGGIVVKPDYRGRGIGLYIQEQAKIIMYTLGIDHAYLFTELTGFYEKTGWVFVEEIYDEKDRLVRLYKLCL